MARRQNPVAGRRLVQMGSLLLRQVHPSFVSGDVRVSSRVFDPWRSGEEQGRNQRVLSVYDGSLISAQSAFQHYTDELGGGSCGVLAVDEDECASLGITVDRDGIGFPEHVSLNFGGLSRGSINEAAKMLLAHAVERGWQYGPVNIGARRP